MPAQLPAVFFAGKKGIPLSELIRVGCEVLRRVAQGTFKRDSPLSAHKKNQKFQKNEKRRMTRLASTGRRRPSGGQRSYIETGWEKVGGRVPTGLYYQRGPRALDFAHLPGKGLVR